ncbi:SUMF1/EgtB/PvdO family nonheme iron enzyme [Sulfuriflexus mobilis]|uniref:SUMF1/EgtB/PvdO family nonheme iron enzyme n=1 Tax=Sulfuriflexus mobilis TaxID=1811807 RepID=UPI000F81BD47|nr:SUMF1/EgtB/PvdO family nonheme iron enzyme [Sulfuriflexus mobilis]
MSIITADTLEQLQAVQRLINDTGRRLNEADYRRQYHTDLSPLGWHVGHCAFLETFWLRETLLGDDRATAGLHELYFPENMPKPERGAALPGHGTHIEWCEQLQAENRALLLDPPARLRAQPLTENDYLARFLLQHHAQHYETMVMVLTQRQLQRTHADFTVAESLEPRLPGTEILCLAAGDYRIGNARGVDAFDNEVPVQEVSLPATRLAGQPVSNSNWLAFMQAGAYQTSQFWSAEGWQWCHENRAQHPEQWRKNHYGEWLGVAAEGPHELDGDAAVSGINYYEATAFVNWLRKTSPCFAEARLPHEYELEIARGQETLQAGGQVWEWCANTFHPYAGFNPFPYDSYSKPWFDGRHYTLRGSSPYTQAAVKRPSFRNFYTADKRHIFSGLRLAL